MLPLLFLVAFLSGSIPFGVLVTRARGIDIRKVGSGNIGATNVTRALGIKGGLIVFALDVLKGLAPTLAARAVVTEPVGGVPPQVIWFFVGFTALLGHVFTPWLRFKGGKGIATGLGFLLATAPTVALSALGVFVLVMIPTRYVSLSSMLATASLVVFGWFLPGQARELVPLYLLLALFIVYKHRDNIRRLRSGQELKFHFKKAESPTQNDLETASPAKDHVGPGAARSDL